MKTREFTSQTLGGYLRHYRHKHTLSIRALATRSGVHHSTLARLENGQIQAPSPELLARLATALDTPLADLYILVDYTTPGDLPEFPEYLRCRYHLSPDVITKLYDYFITLVGYPDDTSARQRTRQGEHPHN